MSAWWTTVEVEVQAGLDEADMAASAVWGCAVSWTRSPHGDMAHGSRARDGEAREERGMLRTKLPRAAAASRWASLGEYARMPDPRSA